MSFLRVVSRFISEFARFILFFASIIFLLSSTLLLVLLAQARKDFSDVEFGGIDKTFAVMLGLSVYLMVLAIIGVFASFFSSKNAIKLLAIMAALNVIVGAAVLISTDKRELVNADLASYLQDLQHKYSWVHLEQVSDLSVKDATLVWDLVQRTMHCCGVKSPADWVPFRPAVYASSNAFPISCCQDEVNQKEHMFCDADDSKLWPSGCSDVLSDSYAPLRGMIAFVVSSGLVICVLSSVVLFFRPSEDPAPFHTGGNYS